MATKNRILGLQQALASYPRQLTRVAAATLLLILALGSGKLADALVGNGFTVHQWGTTKDETGIKLGSASTRTCFLSGVAGNLNMGVEQHACGLRCRPSTAIVRWNSGNYWLVAHGGAYQNLNNEQLWHNNPVNAQATCVWTATGVKHGHWDPQKDQKPVKIAELGTGNTNVRQCFLSGLSGEDAVWNSSSRFARVIKRTVVDATHPTTGWYIETNLPDFNGNFSPRVSATCVDFPQGTHFSSGSVTAPAGSSKTVAITSGTGVKACALTSVTGAFNVNDWTDGAMMKFPSTVGGNWSLTVKNGKTARWACAR